MLEEKFIKSVRPDPRGRISIGNAILGVADTFHILKNDSGDIILRPHMEVPSKELWLTQDKVALDQISKSYEQSKDGKISKLDRSFLEDE